MRGAGRGANESVRGQRYETRPKPKTNAEAKTIMIMIYLYRTNHSS